MESIKGAKWHPRSVAASQLRAEVERRLWHGDFSPQAAVAVVLKASIYKAGLATRGDVPENLLLDCVSPLSDVKRSQPYRRVARHPSVGLLRVSIGDVQ